MVNGRSSLFFFARLTASYGKKELEGKWIAKKRPKETQKRSKEEDGKWTLQFGFFARLTYIVKKKITGG